MNQLEVEEVAGLHNIYTLVGGAHKMDSDNIQEHIWRRQKCIMDAKDMEKVLQSWQGFLSTYIRLFNLCLSTIISSRLHNI